MEKGRTGKRYILKMLAVVIAIAMMAFSLSSCGILDELGLGNLGPFGKDEQTEQSVQDDQTGQTDASNQSEGSDQADQSDQTDAGSAADGEANGDQTANDTRTGSAVRTSDGKVRVAIAWSCNLDSYSFVSTVMSVREAGGEPVVLDMVRSTDLTYEGDMLKGATDEHGCLTPEAARLMKENTWHNTDAAEQMEGIGCIVFPGGYDISPALFRNEQPWHGIEDEEYSAERDVSDYALMTYCLDQNIPTLAICRGMQLLAIVSGAEMHQDIGQWFESEGVEYSGIHRDAEKLHYVPHSVEIIDRHSLLRGMTGKTSLRGCPSWHHQAVKTVRDTPLRVTARTVTDGIPIIEGLERTDKDWVVGVQYHPEVAVRYYVDEEENANQFMDMDDALVYFRAVIDQVP